MPSIKVKNTQGGPSSMDTALMSFPQAYGDPKYEKRVYELFSKIEGIVPGAYVEDKKKKKKKRRRRKRKKDPRVSNYLHNEEHGSSEAEARTGKSGVDRTSRYESVSRDGRTESEPMDAFDVNTIGLT